MAQVCGHCIKEEITGDIYIKYTRGLQLKYLQSGGHEYFKTMLTCPLCWRWVYRCARTDVVIMS